MKSKMIETQKHHQNFGVLGLFQIYFGLMTLISEMVLKVMTNRKANLGVHFPSFRHALKAI